MTLSADSADAFIRANTVLAAPPHVPEIRLHLADEAHDLWKRTEEELAGIGLPPPFWAFAWAGGQGLARYVLDNRAVLAGRSVVDFATGSGLVAIAAALAGAGHVLAADIDPFSHPACKLNRAANGVDFSFTGKDLVGTDDGWEIVLAGDVFYDRELADRLIPWFSNLRRRGAEILIGDPGRSYLPKDLLQKLAVYDVPVSRELEDSEIKRTTVWRFA